MIRRCLHSILSQDLAELGNVEIVVSDHSADRVIEQVCRDLKLNHNFSMKYLRKDWKTDNPSSSLNFAFGFSSGEIIKILFLDDFLIGSQSLLRMVNALESNAACWLACGTVHTRDGKDFFHPHYPSFHRQIQYGRNTISSPSVVAIKRECWQPFDEALFWLMDVDFYKRVSIKFGPPLILSELLIATGLGAHQATNSLLSWKEKLREHGHVLRKYNSWGRIPLVVISLLMARLLRVFGSLRKRLGISTSEGDEFAERGGSVERKF